MALGKSFAIDERHRGDSKQCFMTQVKRAPAPQRLPGEVDFVKVDRVQGQKSCVRYLQHASSGTSGTEMKGLCRIVIVFILVCTKRIMVQKCENHFCRAGDVSVFVSVTLTIGVTNIEWHQNMSSSRCPAGNEVY